MSHLRDPRIPTVTFALSGSAVAAVVALAGRRAGRRAALRGALSAGLVAAVPIGRSQTATVAAAFTGAALEFPPGAAAFGGWALATATFNGHLPRHVTRRVAGEIATGVTAALLTMRFWPLADHTPAAASVLPDGIAHTPSPEGAGMTVVANPSAGAGRLSDPVKRIEAELPAARLVEATDDEPMERTLEAAAAYGETLGVVGGDGTINAAARAALAAGVPLAVFPGGTLNHFARDLGLETVDDAVAAIRSGRLVAVDVGTIDGRPFLNTASFGSYSEFVKERERLEARIGKWPAMLVGLVNTLRHGAPLDVEIDGRPARIWMIFIGNCAYDPPGFAPSARNRLDDGMFDIRIVDGSEPWARARLILAVLTGQLARSKVYSRRLQPRLEVVGQGESTELAVDGEVFTGSSRFTVEKSRSALLVHAPTR